LFIGVGLVQFATFALGIVIWEEWPGAKFLYLAFAIASLNGSITGLFVLVALLGAKFPDELNGTAGRSDVRRLQLERPKTQQADFDRTGRLAA
jgi:hypothetical protein